MRGDSQASGGSDYVVVRRGPPALVVALLVNPEGHFSAVTAFAVAGDLYSRFGLDRLASDDTGAGKPRTDLRSVALGIVIRNRLASAICSPACSSMYAPMTSSVPRSDPRDRHQPTVAFPAASRFMNFGARSTTGHPLLVQVRRGSIGRGASVR